jgi:hypothetical protein
MVWTDSWPSIAGAGCGLICVGAGEERARKVLASWGLQEVKRQVGSARWTRWPDGIKCGPHVGKKSKTKLSTISLWSLKTKVELVQGSGQVIERGKTE